MEAVVSFGVETEYQEDGFAYIIEQYMSNFKSRSHHSHLS